jgi:uncharacterized damage-inducible protein DinB
MLEPQIIHAMAAYNTYANGVLLEAAAQVRVNELTRTASPSRGSLLVLIHHMLAVEAHYLAACRQQRFVWDPLAYPGVPELQALAARLGQEAEQFIAGLGEGEASQEVPLQLAGNTFHFPIWQLLLQAYLHSSQHRGELSILLSNLGHPLAISDPIARFAMESAQPWPWS